jgi:ribosomal protein S18 acetylase RimI-like enzyme
MELYNLKQKEIGKNLLEKIEDAAKNLCCKNVELTVDPENISSKIFFEKNGYLNVSSNEGETINVMGNNAVKDYYKPGRHFILLQKVLV